MKIGENEKIAELLTEQLVFSSDSTDEANYKDSTYFVISRVAYLIGVPKTVFEKPHSSPQITIFEQLDAIFPELFCAFWRDEIGNGIDILQIVHHLVANCSEIPNKPCSDHA